MEEERSTRTYLSNCLRKRNEEGIISVGRRRWTEKMDEEEEEGGGRWHGDGCPKGGPSGVGTANGGAVYDPRKPAPALKPSGLHTSLFLLSSFFPPRPSTIFGAL